MQDDSDFPSIEEKFTGNYLNKTIGQPCYHHLAARVNLAFAR